MVPNGWEVKPLSNITKWSSGGTPSKNNPDYWNGEIPWISAASMRGHYFENSELKISDLAVSKGAKMAPKNSILLLVRGSMLWNKIPVGIVARKVSFNQDVKCLVPHADELTTEFLLYWFLTYEHRLMNMVTGTGIGAGKLDTTDLQGLDVFLPPLPEQRKIAQILSTWDKAIATTEKLIDASKQQKKALMQQLLSGKKRLVDPETGKKFEGEWKLTTVDEMCNVGRGRVISKKEISENSGIYPVYSSQTLNNGVMGQIGTFDFEGEYATWTTDGVNAGTVFYRTGKFNCTNVCGTLQPKNKAELSTQFLALALSLEAFKYVSHTLANPKLMNNVMKTVSFKIPQFSEQQKIASVLTTSDKEIELLEAKLVYFKQEKKALMQQLLTGKRLVKVAETEAA